MKDLLDIVSLILTVLLTIETVLYRYIKRKNDRNAKKLTKKIKEYAVIYIVILFLFGGWLFFFEDKSVYLECQRETMTCRHFHTTYSNNKIRLTDTYDISRVTHARIKKHHRRRGSSFYTVELREEKSGFNLPPHYGSSGAAQKEANRFNRFLSNKENVYIYRKKQSEDSFAEVMTFMACLFAIFILIRLFWDLVEAAFKEHKRSKKQKKKELFQTQDDVIQRNR